MWLLKTGNLLSVVSLWLLQFVLSCRHERDVEKRDTCFWLGSKYDLCRLLYIVLKKLTAKVQTVLFIGCNFVFVSFFHKWDHFLVPRILLTRWQSIYPCPPMSVWQLSISFKFCFKKSCRWDSPQEMESVGRQCFVDIRDGCGQECATYFSSWVLLLIAVCVQNV